MPKIKPGGREREITVIQYDSSNKNYYNRLIDCHSLLLVLID